MNLTDLKIRDPTKSYEVTIENSTYVRITTSFQLGSIVIPIDTIPDWMKEGIQVCDVVGEGVLAPLASGDVAKLQQYRHPGAIHMYYFYSELPLRSQSP